MWQGRVRFWVALAVCWGAAFGALYLHPALWALFGMVVLLFGVRGVKAWWSGQ